MSSQTWDLLQGCEEARKIGSELQLELRDIFSQVLTARYQCTLKDRSLCDTLQPIGFDVVFTVKNVSRHPTAKTCPRPLQIIHSRQLLIPLHNNQ